MCFEQKYEKVSAFLSERFPFLVVKFSIYLNRHVFVMISSGMSKVIFKADAYREGPDQQGYI